MYAGKNRRTHTRYATPSMYTSLVVRPIGVHTGPMEGHVYDISEGGVRFEIDEALPAGTPIELEIAVPGPTGMWPGGNAPVRVRARVVRLEEDDVEQGGPIRTACVFDGFASEQDHTNLLRRMAGGRFARAA